MGFAVLAHHNTLAANATGLTGMSVTIDPVSRAQR